MTRPTLRSPYSYRRIVLRFRAVSVMTVSFYGSMGLLLWYGGHKVAHGAMTPGRLTEFLFYMGLLQGPIRQIAMIFASAARATSSGGRLFEILDIKAQIADKPEAPRLEANQRACCALSMWISAMTRASSSCMT